MKQKIFYIALVPVALAIGWFFGAQSHQAAPKELKPPEVNNSVTAVKGLDHGEHHPLGSTTILDKDFSITRFGELIPGREGAFEVSATRDLSNLSAYLWVESKDGTRISAPAKGTPEKGKLHFHVLAHANSEPYRVVLRVREGGQDERASLPLDGHGHEHGSGPHHGVLAKLLTRAGKQVGFVELKLHDDKGDLELWIAKDEKMTNPLDFPLHSQVQIKFVDHGNKNVALRVRNTDQNEDEDGTANIRRGKTNYFIFPFAAEHNSRWLMGKDFSSIVLVSFEDAGTSYVSEEFVLKPHTHVDGQEH